MKLAIALGVAIAALTVAASAQSTHRFLTRHHASESADTNSDGWLSREEAAANADRLFADFDYDDNARLTDEDREAFEDEIEAHVENAMREVSIELEGLDEEIEAQMQTLDDENCTTTTENEGATRRVTVICENEDGEAGDRERRVDRHVRIIRNGGHMVVVPPIPPVPPVPPAPPMPRFQFMFGGEDSEADLNGDGALSREEFRAQQLRFFDAQDANNDGRIRNQAPPAPPQPPTPPAPPAPPRHR